MSVKEKKKIIRDLYLKNRSKISNRNIVDRKLNENILSFLKKKKNIRLAGYFAVRGEVSVNQSMCELNINKNTICVPKMVENSKKLIFISWKNNTPLKRGKFNIPIPRTCDEVTPNFILVPLVSFDKKKNRLGYGGGYYDYTMNTLQKKKVKFFSIGIAYDQQFYSDLPTENFDITLDIIITQSKVIS